MRAMLTLGSLLIVLAIVGLSVRSQLQADKRFLPTVAASGAASAAYGATNPTLSQFQGELDKAMKSGAQHSADQAASAGEDGTR